MIADLGIRISEWEDSRVATRRKALRLRPVRCVTTRLLALRNPQSAIRNGLTLIELLVVIIILTTLVAGVIPVLSPNNDTRKIREASRMLQTYIHMAQAEAARTGRSHGIAFQESSPGSSVALEVYRLEVPAPFHGFSEYSRVRVTQPSSPTVYNPGASNTFKFHPQFNGFDLYQLTFELAGSGTGSPVYDPLPPRMFRVGDEINVSGNRFVVVDDSRNIEQQYGTSTTFFLDPSQYPMPYTNALICAWINSTGQVPPQGLQKYEIIRQPANSPEPPMQFPAAIAIDMQGSVAEGSAVPGFVRFPKDDSLFQATTALPNTVGIMFSPTGSVTNVYLNGTTLTNVSRIVLLLGRVENGGLTESGAEWTIATGATNDELETKQQEINWLNLDSRWLSIAANSGRVVVTENAFVDARLPGLIGSDDFETAEFQIEAAHEFAHEMRRGGGG